MRPHCHSPQHLPPEKTCSAHFSLPNRKFGRAQVLVMVHCVPGTVLSTQPGGEGVPGEPGWCSWGEWEGSLELTAPPPHLRAFQRGQSPGNSRVALKLLLWQNTQRGRKAEERPALWRRAQERRQDKAEDNKGKQGQRWRSPERETKNSTQ